MPNQEILTGLKNAVDHGENLQTAMQIMINSGYNPQEVQEASRLIGSGALHTQKPKPEEQLTMPEKKKSFFSKLLFWKKSKQEISRPTPPKQVEQPVEIQTQTPITSVPQPQLSKQLKQIKPKKKSYIKEIILLIILLVLITVLILSFVFKDTILGWFG
jgi:hypothetical protein